MGLLNAVANIGKAVIDTTLIVTVDPLVSLKEAMDGDCEKNRCTKRSEKIVRDLENAYEETFDD